MGFEIWYLEFHPLGCFNPLESIYNAIKILIRMMTFSEVQQLIQINKPALSSKFKVKNIGVFGSFVDGEESENSDIDIMVELYEPIGWDFIELKDYLEKILSKPIDLVTNKALKPMIKDDILKEVIYP